MVERFVRKLRIILGNPDAEHYSIYITDELSHNLMGHNRVTKDVLEYDIVKQTEKKNAALSWDS